MAVAMADGGGCGGVAQKMFRSRRDNKRHTPSHREPEGRQTLPPKTLSPLQNEKKQEKIEKKHNNICSSN